MNTIYLISTQCLKENTSINDNVADYLLSNAIREAQDINVQQVTGTVLYRKILSLVSNDEIQMEENVKYKELLDTYIIPVVIYYAYLYAVPSIRYKVQNTGVVNQSSDNSTPSDIKDVQFVMDDIRNKAEYYANILGNFLKANYKEYPEYLANKNIDEKRPMIHQYTCGLVLSDVYPDKPHYNTLPVYL